VSCCVQPLYRQGLLLWRRIGAASLAHMGLRGVDRARPWSWVDSASGYRDSWIATYLQSGRFCSVL